MGQPFTSLTLFRLRDRVAGKPVNQLRDFIDPAKKTSAHSLRGTYDFLAQLFVAPRDEGPPSWLEPLKSGFGALTEIPDSISSSAVLIIHTKRSGRDLHFAATFGFGRFLLRPGSFERNYGMRVALNAIYPRRRGERIDPERLRSVDSKTVGPNTLRTKRQVNRKANFEMFEFDIERDLLSGLTGTPFDIKTWGSRIDGSDAVYLHRSVPFDQLGRICLQLERNSTRVPREFSWVDKIFAVRDAALIDSLKQRILDMIQSGRISSLELAPPELVDWGEIAGFEFSFDPDYSFVEPSIEDYIRALRRKNKLTKLNVGQLVSGHRLVALDANGNRLGNWTIFSSLSGEIEHRSPSYILSEGEFFEVDGDYISKLNKSLDRIKEFTGDLPESRVKWSEDRYNKEASKTKQSLLLDKKTVRLTSRTSAIEICDVLRSERILVHVKKKLNSSSLSHLFSQGLVSADLLLMSQEFRRRVRDRIAPLEKARGLGNRFSKLFPLDGISARDFTVVYGIITQWKKKTMTEALPFFSKVNLRRCLHDLTRMGYNVAYRRISEAAGVHLSQV